MVFFTVFYYFEKFFGVIGGLDWGVPGRGEQGWAFSFKLAFKGWILGLYYFGKGGSQNPNLWFVFPI